MSADESNAPSVRRPGFFGRIDWRALPSELGSAPVGRNARIPGLDLSIGDSVSFAATPRGIAICAGRPRFADPAFTQIAKEHGSAGACLELGRKLGDDVATGGGVLRGDGVGSCDARRVAPGASRLSNARLWRPKASYASCDRSRGFSIAVPRRSMTAENPPNDGSSGAASVQAGIAE